MDQEESGAELDLASLRLSCWHPPLRRLLRLAALGFSHPWEQQGRASPSSWPRFLSSGPRRFPWGPEIRCRTSSYPQECKSGAPLQECGLSVHSGFCPFEKFKIYDGFLLLEAHWQNLFTSSSSNGHTDSLFPSIPKQCSTNLPGLIPISCPFAPCTAVLDRDL